MDVGYSYGGRSVCGWGRVRSEAVSAGEITTKLLETESAGCMPESIIIISILQC